MSIFDVISQVESGNRNIPNTTATTSSGQAQGFYQITTGTWADFAPRAGVNLAQYPTPLSAPADVQTQVASVIPLSRWAPSTQQAVFANYGQLNPSQTLGVLNAETGGGHLSPNGVQLASTGTGQGGATSAPATSAGSVDEFGRNPVTIAPDQATAQLQIGLMPQLAKGITDAVNAGIATVTAPFKAAFASLADWFTRGALILVGLVIMALALWHLMAPSGMGPAAVARKLA